MDPLLVDIATVEGLLGLTGVVSTVTPAMTDVSPPDSVIAIG
ncbi:MAG: hypothetical protein WCP03_00630 [Candidatus Saccharibacteria bacterium]